MLVKKLFKLYNSDKVFVVALQLRLALWLNNGKWFAGIYTVGKKVLLYVG